MTRVAARAGLGRESLYKALSPQGNPEFATVVKVMQALGFQLIRSVPTGMAQPIPPRSNTLWEDAFVAPSRPFEVRAFVSGQENTVQPRQWAYS